MKYTIIFMYILFFIFSRYIPLFLFFLNFTYLYILLFSFKVPCIDLNGRGGGFWWHLNCLITPSPVVCQLQSISNLHFNFIYNICQWWYFNERDIYWTLFSMSMHSVNLLQFICIIYQVIDSRSTTKIYYN